MYPSNNNQPIDFSAYQTAPVTMPQTPQVLGATTESPPPPSPAPTPAISSAILTPTPVQNFSQPTQTNPYPVASLTVPDFSNTPAQQKESDLSTQLQSLINQDTGKTAYGAQQDEAFGVNTAQKTITDLSAQLTGLQNEYKAIPLQLQQQSEGRGITTGGLEPIQVGELRKNAIAALGVSTLLEAAQGNLANAQRLSANAVTQKYGPIEEQIAAGMKNLQLIQNSPEYTNAEKKRAFEQTQYLEQQQQQIAQQKLNESQKWDIATTAAANIKSFTPTPQYATAALALDAMKNAQTPQDALAIATATGLMQAPQKAVEQWSDPYLLGGDYVQKNAATGEIRTAVNVSSKSGITNFSTTQMNKGAANAGLSADTFKGLPGDVQNLFVNNKATADDLVNIVAGVKAGNTTAEDARNFIDSQNISTDVKDYFRALVPGEVKGASTGGGFWDWVGSFING